MCPQPIGWLELVGSLAGFVSALLMAWPTWNDICGKEKAGRFRRLAALIVSSENHLVTKMAEGYSQRAGEFRAADKRALIWGFIFIAFAFILPLLNKVTLSYWPSLYFCAKWT